MMGPKTCDHLVALSAELGDVPGLMKFASEIDQVAVQLLNSPELGRDQLCELKESLTRMAETIGRLRRAAATALQTLGMEFNNAG
jgi:hypothetical protein